MIGVVLDLKLYLFYDNKHASNVLANHDFLFLLTEKDIAQHANFYVSNKYTNPAN